MAPTPPYSAALARARAVLEFHRARPEFLARSVKLRDAVGAAARAAFRDGLSLAVVSAALGRLAAEALDHAPRAAVETGGAMARWAAREHRKVIGGGAGDAG